MSAPLQERNEYRDNWLMEPLFDYNDAFCLAFTADVPDGFYEALNDIGLRISIIVISPFAYLTLSLAALVGFVGDGWFVERKVKVIEEPIIGIGELRTEMLQNEKEALERKKVQDERLNQINKALENERKSQTTEQDSTQSVDQEKIDPSKKENPIISNFKTTLNLLREKYDSGEINDYYFKFLLGKIQDQLTSIQDKETFEMAINELDTELTALFKKISDRIDSSDDEKLKNTWNFAKQWINGRNKPINEMHTDLYKLEKPFVILNEDLKKYATAQKETNSNVRNIFNITSLYHAREYAFCYGLVANPFVKLI